MRNDLPVIGLVSMGKDYHLLGFMAKIFKPGALATYQVDQFCLEDKYSINRAVCLVKTGFNGWSGQYSTALARMATVISSLDSCEQGSSR